MEDAKENHLTNANELLIIGDVAGSKTSSLQDNFKKFRDRKLSDRKLQVGQVGVKGFCRHRLHADRDHLTARPRLAKKSEMEAIAHKNTRTSFEQSLSSKHTRTLESLTLVVTRRRACQR